MGLFASERRKEGLALLVCICVMRELASMLQDQHRFYGESVPLGSIDEAMNDPDTRNCLNIEQAPADFADIIQHIKQNLSAPNSPVIVIGGSYAGITTTSQAITALKMLRENKDKFDLVISDVHMPDMDGFKLELVGLEMDLPVIMLSTNDDTKLVMKGISHGACDYLLKPVRLEELKNIWQHVIRRKKFDSRDRNGSNSRDKNSNDENGNRGANSDQDAKLSRKRKDQNMDDDEDQDENEHENEDPSSQKKPRVVWSVELHRKFVAAVNQLGLDKAVPKKILELMNVDKLTRENVASHLQK